MLAAMSLSEQKLLHSYLLLHHVFPEDMHIVRPLIQMLQRSERIKEARNLALSMARRMLASGKGGFALGFLAICKQLDHPKTEEIEALSNMARITSAGFQESSSGSGHLFALIDQLSDQEALDFISQATLIQAEAGHDIVTQGEASETFYLILEGSVDVRLMLADGRSKTLTTLNAGDLFGEFACLYKLNRTATISANSLTRMLEFSSQSITQLMERSPLAGDQLIRTVQTRMVHAMTHAMPAFSQLPEEDKIWAAEESVVHSYESGETIPISDLSAPVCHIILSGEAELNLPDGQQIKLSSGDFFGTVNPHIELPFESEIKTKQRALVCEMPENIFNTFMKLYASFEQHVEQVNTNRFI